jgi:hypothetical protein
MAHKNESKSDIKIEESSSACIESCSHHHDGDAEVSPIAMVEAAARIAL